MPFLVHSLRATTLTLALAAAFSASAQTPQLKETVVTATRTMTRTDQLVSDVRVIDRAAIEASTARSVPELLAREAGVQMSSNGGLGKNSSVFIRGTESRHTLLLVDGVRLGSATLGTPSWDNLPLEMIERIEVLKGPASALYGSDGVGGVVQIFTRKGRAGVHPHASLTVGSRGHLQGAAGVQGGQGPLQYAVGVQRLRERGFSATNPRVPFGAFNPDADGFEQESVNLSADYRLTQNWSLQSSLLYADGHSAFDNGPGRDSQTALRTLTGQAGVRGRLAAGWQSALSFSQGNDTSNTSQVAFPGSFTTKQSQWSWQNDIETPLGVALAGLERREQRVDSSTMYAVRERTIDSVFGGLNGSAGDHSWQFNLRRDRNSQFGTADTGFAGYGYRFTPALRVHASYGTSFVAPSFNQLYFPGFGEATLQPERGRNIDLGLTWTSGAHEVKLVHFDNRLRNLIVSVAGPVGLRAQNVGRARIDGWTLGYQGRIDRLALRSTLDLLDPRDERTGGALARRANRQATLGADYDLGAWSFGGTLLHVGSRPDLAGRPATLGAYTTADLHADWRFAKDLSLQAKLNNATDKQYETALGYNQAPRSLYLTLRWQPK